MPKPPADLPDHQVTLKPKLDKRKRCQLSTEYKLRLLVEADACQHGKLLCRVQLYSSQLTTWRKELAVKNVRVDKLHNTTSETRVLWRELQILSGIHTLLGRSATSGVP